MRNSNERGIAMITTLLVLMLISALLVGFTTVVMSDQRYRFIDRDRGQAFYAASGGVEKLTADLGDLFFTNIAPTGTQVIALTNTSSQPVIPGVTFSSAAAPDALPASNLTPLKCVAPKVVTTSGTNGYTVKYCANAAGNPTTITPPLPIASGAYEGLIALQTPYQLDVTARSTTGGEVHLVRTLESVAIPIFQFGIFSDVDLSFFAGDDFSFGGRVHTNGNLFLAESQLGSPAPILYLSDKVTAVKEVIRQRMSNNGGIDAVGMAGDVKLWTGSAWRSLLRTEGSVVDGIGSATTEPAWHTTSLSSYNSYVRNSRTGAKALNLSLTMTGIGGSNLDVIERPPVGENVTNSILYGERLYGKASLRILLSDTLPELTNLPQVTAAGAMQLDGNWNAAAQLAPYGAVGGVANPSVAAGRLPVALSPGVIMATVLNTSAAAGGTINFANAAAAAPFKPTFTLAGSPNVITCTGKTTVAPWRLTGCVGTPIIPTTLLGTMLTAISPAGGSVGASAPIWIATNNLNNWIEFQTSALLNTFTPAPFWDAVSDTLVTCTGYTATSYTGCSSLPANNATLMSAAMSNAGIGLLGGWIKIDRQQADGQWRDVTAEILSYGIGDRNQGGAICADPTQFAIIRLQRLRDNGGAAGGGCNYNTDGTGAKDPTNWWPLSLFDARESALRDDPALGPLGQLTLGGVMYYVSLDVGNLQKWFKGTVAPYNAGTGTATITDNGGFTVYFSDRRNNRNSLGLSTGEYGWEDYVNPAVASGVPNNGLDGGEDVNANALLDVYGGVPNYNGVYNQVPTCAVCVAQYTSPAPLPAASATPYLTTAARPITVVDRRVAQVNRPILFRRALKLVNGGAIGSGAYAIPGLTIVSENPVYIQGDWNSTAAFTVAEPHAATAVIADAVTVLSSAWTDNNSFAFPFISGSRPRAAQSYYRVAVIGGKGPDFARPAWDNTSSVFGTDGGAHNFLRMLEGGLGTTVNYRGSLATLFFNRQAVGTFKCCSGTAITGIVYSVPTRNFNFDVDFLDPAKLPPNTPVFRDLNAVGFSQELRPGK